MLANLNGMAVLGIDNKRIKEKGITLLEALISTAIVGIGFIAVFQMVNYSITSIDVSGERTKSNYLISMIAEDLIGDRTTNKGSKKIYEHLADQSSSNNYSWQIANCAKKIGSPYKNTDIAIDNKMEKWNHRLSPKRIKCRGSNDIKQLKVFEICKDGVREDGKVRPNCDYRNDDIWDKTYIGRMEVNLNNGKKKRFLYFQIH